MRQADLVDVPAIVDVQRAGAVRAFAHIFPQDAHPFPTEPIAARWRAEIADPATEVFVLEHDDGAVVGFAATRADQLRHFGTAVHTWGSGLAADAHDVVLDHLRATGATRAWLWALVDNHRARRFYEKLGWHATDVVRRSPFPPHPSLVEYRRDL